MADNVLPSFFMPTTEEQLEMTFYKQIRYFVYFNYFATGEGMTDAFGFYDALSPKHAAGQLVREVMCKNLTDPEHIKEAVDYFTVGCEVYDVDDEAKHGDIKDVLEAFVAPKVADYIFETMKERVCLEHTFYLYTNHS